MSMFRTIFLCSLGAAAIGATAAACGGSTDSGVTPPVGDDGGTNDASATDGSSPGDGSMQGDTGMNPGDSGGMGTIPCGNGVTCSLATQECCIVPGDAGMGGTGSCIAKGGQCMGISLQCASAANCSGGEVCCGSQMNGAQCAPSPCGQGEVQLCASSQECPMGDRCRGARDGGIGFCLPGGGFDGGRFDGGRFDGGMRDAAID